MEGNSSQTATALLTEHLQYTPLSLIDDIINSVNNFIYQGVGSLETGLLSTPPERLGFKPQPDSDGNVDYSQAKQEIEEGLQKLETLLNSTVDKKFDMFEIYVLRNVLSVPADLAEWVRLKHYEHLSLAQTDNAPTAESIQLLRRKLNASRTMSRSLVQEQARNEAILQQLRTVTGTDGTHSLAFLTQDRAARKLNVAADSQGLTTNTTFAMSQLPALKSLLTELRPKLASLEEVSTGIESAKDEIRQERREYIEQRTKSLLNRNGDAMADNASALPAKALDPDEVHAMEKVAQMFNPA